MEIKLIECHFHSSGGKTGWGQTMSKIVVQGKKIETDAGEQGLEQLDELERQILACLREKGMLSKSQLVMYIGKSSGTIKNRLRNLIKLKRIKANGKEHDPKRTYEIL